MDEKSRTLMSFVSTLMLALITASFIFMEVGSRVHASHVNTWPVIRGQVTYSAPENDCGKGLRYSPKILYSYDVNGHHFEGDQVQYKFFRCGSKEGIAAFTDKFPVGASLDVRVNPASPKDAVAIVDKEQGQDSVPFAVWISVFVGCLLASFAYFRRYRSFSN
jgi:hypothetical protein